MKQSYSQSPRCCFPVIFLLPPFCFFFEFKKNLINECISQSVLSLCCCAWAFSSCGEQGRLFSCSTQASYCGGFTRGAQALGPEGFCSCGLWAQQLWLADSSTGLAAPQHVGSSQTRDQTCAPCIGRWILVHCTSREVHLPSSLLLLPPWRWKQTLKSSVSALGIFLYTQRQMNVLLLC